jgi:hypothetical protein
VGEHDHLVKVEIDGAWWAVDENGAWHRWDADKSDWVASAAPKDAAGAEYPSPTTNAPVSSAPAIKHWAADPVQRAMFIGFGAVLIFLIGLIPVHAGYMTLSSLLFVYPLLAVGMIWAFLKAGTTGAKNPGFMQRGGPATLDDATRKNLMRGWSIGIGIAAMAFPLAAVLSGTVSPLLLVPVALGVFMAFYLGNFPKRFNPNMLLVPIAVVCGGAGALAWGMFVAFMTFMGGGDPSVLGLGIAWVLTSIFIYGTMTEWTGRFSGNRVTGSRLIQGFLFTLVGSIGAVLVAAGMFSSEL